MISSLPVNHDNGTTIFRAHPPSYSHPKQSPTERQELAKKNHVKRPSGALPYWEETPLAKVTATPEGYICTLFGDQWRETIAQTLDLSNRRGDFRKNFFKVCKALTAFLDYEVGIIRASWETIAHQAGTSRRTVARVLSILKSHYLIGVIASGRSAAKTPRGQEQRNLAPVYTLLIPAPRPSSSRHQDSSSFYDENGHLFVTGTPSPLRDEKISFLDAQKTGAFSTFFKQQYGLYAQAHRKTLELKRQGLKDSYRSQKERKKDLTHLARVLQHHCYDLRGVSARSILDITLPFFEAGWSTRDILHSLEHRPDGQPWNTKGATGMRSIKSWLSIRLSAWVDEGVIRDSITAVEDRDWAQRKAAREAEKTVVKPIKGPPVEVKRQLKIIAHGEVKARHIFPELF